MDKPISPKLAESFFQAVRVYVRLGFMGPEPSITADQDDLVPISTVCRRVDTFTDPLPDEVFDALYFLATEKHLKEKLDAQRTYATGAQSLLKLIERRKAEWGRKVPHSMTLCGLVHVADGTCSAANAPGDGFETHLMIRRCPP